MEWIVSYRKSLKDDKVAWVKIGKAWRTKKGDIHISLDALPLGPDVFLFAESKTGYTDRPTADDVPF